MGNTTFFDCMTTPGGAEVCPTAISIADGNNSNDPNDPNDDDAVAVMYECAPLIARRPSATTCQLLANRAVPLANRPGGGPTSPPAANRTEFAGCYNQMVRRRVQGHRVIRAVCVVNCPLYATPCTRVAVTCPSCRFERIFFTCSCLTI